MMRSITVHWSLKMPSKDDLKTQEMTFWFSKFDLKYANGSVSTNWKLVAKIRKGGNRCSKSLQLFLHQTSLLKSQVCTEQVQVSIVDSQGKNIFETIRGDLISWKNHDWKSGHGFGFARILGIDELIEKFEEFCPDGNLHIRFKMLVSLRPPFDRAGESDELENDINEVEDGPPKKRVKIVDDLFDIMIVLPTDVSLKFKDDSELKVNSQKLMENSPKFANLLAVKLSGVVEIADLSRDVMIELLRYIYCGKIRDIRKNGIEVFKAACKYEVFGLVEECSKAISRHVLDEENVLEIVKLAVQYSEDLFDSCCIVIKLFFGNVNVSEDWRNMESTVKIKILERIVSLPINEENVHLGVSEALKPTNISSHGVPVLVPIRIYRRIMILNNQK